MIPLPKKANVVEAGDLRPISLLPLPGKISERIICKRLSLFLEHNELLTPQQHGFRKGNSTITSIAALLNSMYDNINNNKPTY